MLKAPHPYVRFPDLFFFLSWKIHHHKSSHSATVLPVKVGKLRHGGVRTLPRIQHPSVVSHCYFYFSYLLWAACPCCHLPQCPQHSPAPPGPAPRAPKSCPDCHRGIRQLLLWAGARFQHTGDPGSAHRSATEFLRIWREITYFPGISP